MQELSRLRQEITNDDDAQRQYVLDLLEDKKALMKDNEDLRA